MAKSLLVAYVLWFIGGWQGLHHIYLRRDRHAFVWICTLGGIFGLGWLRDMCRLPDYVSEANEDREYCEELKEKMRRRSTPKFNNVRFAGELCMGLLLGYLTYSAVPEEFTEKMDIFSASRMFVLGLSAVGVAVGVWIVANIGHEEGSFSWAMLGSGILYPWYLTNTGALAYSAITSAIAVNWKGKSWKPKKKKRGLCIRLFLLSLCCAIYVSLWISAFYFNAYITTKDGESVKIRVAIHNFFKSPAWAETKSTFKQLYEFYKLHGFGRLWEQLVDALDPEGENNAQKVLGINSSTSQKEINAKCKKLSRQWHPDRFKLPKEKKEAEEKFIEIQKACDLVSELRNRRANRNKRRDRDEF
ncbi:dnaJ homolog subfamily C member 22-like [Lingula anatina]|uniref:DnaJ homolog subfamily C member 22 n=1 Tax=Lingula anatina TaxID=7574 RepID=A0A1S3IIH6_LINAN|nr:dnaJ homolog subfamily C member 22-like [Lingula anatina]|eukprot:XP_013397686.1 dnaJ homolog subfamily C member 22-like [Lingula anatina]